MSATGKQMKNARQKVTKARRRLGRGLYTRTFFFAVLLLLQIVLTFSIPVALGRSSAPFYIGAVVVSVVAVIALLEHDGINPAYKMMWILIILLMPPLGVVFYLFWGHRNTTNRHARRMSAICARLSRTLPQDPEALHRLEVQDKSLARSARYLIRNAGAPLYADTQSEYYAWGEEFFPRFLEELKKAERSIFME